MKKITNTTGSTIKFLLSGTQALEITEEGVFVSDSEALILSERLGTQIHVEDAEMPLNVEQEPVVEEPTHTREELVDELGEEKVAEIEATAEPIE